VKQQQNYGRIDNWYRIVVGHLLVAPSLAAVAAMAYMNTDKCAFVF
jgi:hypothetical protein